MTTTIPKPKSERPQSILWPVELNVVLQLGYWDSPDQILSEALDALLAKYPELRQAVAIELYRQDVVSLSRAAEIADMDRWSFADLLRAHQIEIVVEPDSDEEMIKMLTTLQSSAAT